MQFKDGDRVIVNAPDESDTEHDNHGIRGVVVEGEGIDGHSCLVLSDVPFKYNDINSCNGNYSRYFYNHELIHDKQATIKAILDAV